MISKSARLICALLLLSMFAALFAGCGGGGQSGGDVTTAPVVEEENLKVPDIKYDDYEFKVLVSGNYANNDFKVEEGNSDIVNAAKLRKNSATEEKLGVKISNTDEISFGSTRGAGPGFKALQQCYVSGSYDYDMAMVGAYDCATLAYNSYLSDIKSIPYISLESSWWDSNATDDLSVLGKLFFTTGDISLTYKHVTHCILFNKDLVKEYGDLRNPYELVRSNNWTYDTFGEEVKKMYADLNADGKEDREDRFGLLTWNDPHMAVISSANEKIITVKDDGTLELTLYTDRTVDALAKYCDIIFDSQHAFNYQYGFPSAEWNKTRDSMFNENRALYYMTTFVTISRHRNMDTDFGILPYPKLNTAQENYCHTDTPFSTQFMVVPALIEDEERTGAVIETLAYYSKQYMTPAYYEKTLVGTYIRDDESKDMLDLIFSTRSYDLGAYYNVGNIGSELTAMLNSRQNTFASLYARIQTSAENQIKSINDKYSRLQS